MVPHLMTSEQFQGLRRQEQGVMMEMYRAKNPTSATSDSHVTHQRSFLSSGSPDQQSSRIRKLEKLIKKRL